MEAADNYGVINLKLEAEVYYVSNLELCSGNVLENHLCGDSMNCALVKEEVMDMDYTVKNSEDILAKGILKDTTSGLLNDVLAAMTRREGGTDDGTSYMFISELRREAYEKGLDFDGSREMLAFA